MGLFSSFFGVDQERIDQVRKSSENLATLYWNKYQKGDWTLDEYNRRMAALNAGAIDAPAAETQIQDAFQSGLQEGIDNVLAAPQAAANQLTKTALFTIPWQVWLALAAYLYFRYFRK